MVFDNRDVRRIGYKDALELRVDDRKALHDDLGQAGAADQFFCWRQIIHVVEVNADAIAAAGGVAAARVDDRVRHVGPDQRQGLIDDDLLAIHAGCDLHRIARVGGGYRGGDRAEAAWLLGADAKDGSRGRTGGYSGKRYAQRPQENRRPSLKVRHIIPVQIALRRTTISGGKKQRSWMLDSPVWNGIPIRSMGCLRSDPAQGACRLSS